ncbi:MAG: hypothetical protein Q4F95_04400 [Oscillospiraceae bacterium]|nr:hypothetical protein [Oscillospiraceae bacterium]
MQKTSTTSKTDSFMRKRINQNFRDNKKIIIVVMLLQLLGLPVLVITNTILRHREELDNIAMMTADSSYIHPNYALYYFFSLVAGIAFGFASLSGILFVFRSFRYLYKKSEVDMNYALPLSSSQRFICDYFSGLFMYVIPYIISLLLSFILFAAGKAVYPEFWDSVQDNFYDIAYLLILGFFIMIMLYTIITLVLVCCGTLFEAVTYTVITNITIPFFIFVLYFSILSGSYGIDYSNDCLPLISYTSPVGALFCAVIKYGIDGTLQSDPDVLYCKFTILFLVCAIMFAGSYFLYKKRKAEDVSRPFVFRSFYYMFAVAGTACVTAGLYANQALIQGIVTGIVYFGIISTIANRGLKKVIPSAVICLVTIVSAVSVTALSKKTDAFGAVTKIPDSDNIKSISVYASNYLTDDFNDFTVSESTGIDALVNFHSDIVQIYKENYNGSNNDNNFEFFDPYNEDATLHMFSIRYTMKNGTTIFRSYSLSHTTWAAHPEIWLSEDYAKSRSLSLKNMLYDPLNRNYDLRISSKYQYNSVSKSGISETAAREISEAYYEDYMALTKDSYMQMKTYCILNNNFIIPESFTKTISLMEKYDLSAPDISEDTSYQIKLLENKQFESGRSAELFISDSDYIKKRCNISGAFLSVTSAYPDIQQYSLNDEFDDDKLTELLTVAEPFYTTDKKCFMIILPYGGKMAIPYEYYDLASEFINSSCHKNG